MKRALFPALTLILFAAVSPAQDSPQGTSPAAANSAPQAQAQTPFAAGSVISAELSKSIDAKKAKPGDRVEAKVTVDLLAEGKIVIPRNAKIIGHITDAKPHSKQSPDSMLGIVFDQISLKDGRELPLVAEVQAVGRPLSSGAPYGGYSPMGASPSPSGNSPGMAGGMPSSQRPSYTPGVPTSPDASGGSVSALGPTSQGVVGMKGLALNVSAQASVISSTTENVRLDGGSQLILRTR
jgi:hypothetical protein